MHRNTLALKKQFLKIDDTTIALLREWFPTIEARLPQVLDTFYERVGGWPELVALFGATPEQQRTGVARAKQAQIAHWKQLFTGGFEADYVASSRRIGTVHSRIGLKPSAYIGGYFILLEQLNAMVNGTHFSRLHPREAAGKTARLASAVGRAVMLDMDLAISSYLDGIRDSLDGRIVDEFEETIDRVTRDLLSSTEAMARSARAVADGIAETGARASASLRSADEATSTANAIAAAAEQLSATNLEIGRQIDRSAGVTGRATEQAEQAMAAVNGLADLAARVDEVAKLIQTIAGQTHLLALNASVEAARAGEAGEGFAVVAAEVKSLAARTEGATTDVSERMNEIKKASAQTVSAIAGIRATIDEINTLTGAVAASVHEQVAATGDITRSIQSAADETARISRSAGALVSAADAAGEAGAQVTRNVADLHTEADRLHREATAFVASIGKQKDDK